MPIAWLLDTWQIHPVSELIDGDYQKNSQINRWSLETSNQIATIIAYQEVGYSVEIKKEKQRVIHVFEQADTELQFGDILPFDFDTLEEKKENLQAGDQLILTIIRDEQEKQITTTLYEEENSILLGIHLMTFYELKTEPKITISNSKKAEGPSAGFMVALTIFDQLTTREKNITGKIAGSGLINLEGQIGEISGLRHKLLGAERNDIAYFLTGQDNLQEALEIKEEYDLTITIKGFKTFNEAINFIYKEES